MNFYSQNRFLFRFQIFAGILMFNRRRHPSGRILKIFSKFKVREIG